MYKVILIDIDDTLLDFDKAETAALIDTLEKYNIKYDEHVIKDYKRINLDYWHKFEKGLTTIPELMIDRFRDFLSIHKIESLDKTKDINEYYLSRLNEKNDIIPDACEVIRELQKKYQVYPASNGVGETQVRRIETSQLKGLFSKYYISGFIGNRKPEKAFFDYIFNDLNGVKKEEFLMVGDSLSSDIQGGINAGIDTCFFNHRGKAVKDVKPTYEIKELKELLEILK